MKKVFMRHWQLYVLLLPALLWYLIFCYLPIGGVSLAFKYFRFDKGILLSPWIGFDHFKAMFADADFWRAFKNTLIFSGGRLLFHFPFPIIIAILMNELSNKTVTKVFQTVFTFPHFISWVVLSGILINMFSSNGIVNQLAAGIGLPEISPLASVAGFRPFIWISNIWKEFGWDGIIYLAALAGIDPQLYESADILDTYVFRRAFFIGDNFGYTTALGLFKSVIGVVMIFGANKIITKSGETGLF